MIDLTRLLTSSINELYPGLGTTAGVKELDNSSCPGEEGYISLEPGHKAHMQEIKNPMRQDVPISSAGWHRH